MSKNPLMTHFNHNNAYVWIWLPGATTPIIAGKLEKQGPQYTFYYGQSYIQNPNAIALSKTELPLISGKRFTPLKSIHYAIRDALPDAWGRRILHHYYGVPDLSTLDILLLSSSDRIGALHFQTTAEQFEPQYENHATLEQLQEAAMLIERGQIIPKELDIALNHGTSIGGARPKATIETNSSKYIAKFSASTDLFPIVQAEFAALWLAKKANLDVPTIKLVKVSGRYVLLVERFDRKKISNAWARKFMISGLTMLALDESEGRYASYLDLADHIRHQCREPIKTLTELYRRMVFNIIIGNTDDHAKNHAFFWDGQEYTLTPAYDICPYPRVGQEATQAMTVGEHGSYSRLSNALSASKWFELTEKEAQQIIKNLVELVEAYWPEACEHAELTPIQQKHFTGTAVLNPFIFL